MTVTAVYCSPRKDGNTDLLLQSFVRGARESGADIKEIVLRQMSFSPCIECGGCNSTGRCVVKDDMQSIYPHLIHSDTIVLSAPVFFYGMNALAKAMVDRCQCLWAAKYLLGKPASIARGCKGSGMLLTLGGSTGTKNFDGILLTVKYFFDALDMDFIHHREYRKIDKKGAVLNHPSACSEAYELGKNLTAEKG